MTAPRWRPGGRSCSPSATGLSLNWPSKPPASATFPDKITKNHRKTLGLLRDIAEAKTCGVVKDDPETGITEIARPMGVVGAIVPSDEPGRDHPPITSSMR